MPGLARVWNRLCLKQTPDTMQTMHKAGHVKPNMILLTPQGHSAPQLYHNTEWDMTALKTFSCKNVHFAKVHCYFCPCRPSNTAWFALVNCFSRNQVARVGYMSVLLVVRSCSVPHWITTFTNA